MTPQVSGNCLSVARPQLREDLGRQPAPKQFPATSTPMFWLLALAVDPAPQLPRYPLEALPQAALLRAAEGGLKQAPRLLLDQPETSTVWVLGEDYKLRLDKQGAKFIPRGQPANQRSALGLGPVQLAVAGQWRGLDSHALPSLSGREVRYDRGALIEVWQLEPQGARQNFLLTEPVGGGDLELTIPVSGDLESSRRQDGLAFRSAQGAEVRYGDWLAVDASGRRIAGASRLSETGISILLPADFLALAAYPLWIDPLISSQPIDSGPRDIYSLDCAMDDSQGLLFTVHEEAFDPEDNDVIGRRYKLNGEFLGEVPIDISDESTVQPAVANHEAADQFLAVWSEEAVKPYTLFRIRGRTQSALEATQGEPFTINWGDGGNSPDVGGPGGTSNKAEYLVVWSDYSLFPLVDPDIAMRPVSPMGELGNKKILDGSNKPQITPSVSKRAGNAGRYLVSYVEELENTVTRVEAALVHQSGEILQSEILLAQGVYGDPDVDGDGSEFLTVFTGRDGDFFGDIYGVRSTFGSSSVHTQLPLSFKELTSAQLALHQTNPCVARTKDGFVYAYMESAYPLNADFRIFLAAIHQSHNPLIFKERHLLLPTEKPGAGYSPSICNALLNGTCLLTWMQAVSGQFDAYLAQYQSP